ncbi:cytochrome b [Flagellimonas pacifica]|uniref:Cytochrome b561 n=1 Tax=Flagellimonas pacifica TaxID=1247520 RepID=A0A285MVF0_9FLAO|nr:cytochrome b/b6 domain-containing protein [Allomuricauda parva]SNZ01165.1 cytochrome b561 [Allomuricauda parva]
MKEGIQNNLGQKYNKGTIAIHWITALLIIALFPLGKYMSGLEPSEKMGLLKVHAFLGVIVFLLTIIRSWLFFTKPRPDDLKTGSKLNDKLAVWIHNSFYFLLFGLAISGIATVVLGGYGEALTSANPELIINREEIKPLKGHGILAMVMMLLLTIHVFGVIKHYILLKENTLKRMI